VSAESTAAGLRLLAQYVEDGRVPKDRFSDLPLRIHVYAESAADVSKFASREGVLVKTTAPSGGGLYRTAALMLEDGVELVVCYISKPPATS
jgi:hypothetical protein